MPFYDERPNVSDLSNIQVPGGPEPDPSLMATFGAAFRTQNVIGSAVTMMGTADAYRVEEDFDPVGWAVERPNYAPFAEEFAGITNRHAAEVRGLQIDSEMADRRTLDAAGSMGVVAEMAAGVVDLPSLLPVGTAIGGGRLVSIAGRAAVGAGMDAAISEAGLQATQVTRTLDETALNIGGSIVLGGALGTLAGKYLDSSTTIAISRKIEREAAEFDDIDRAYAAAGANTPSGGAQSAGAAAVDKGPLVLKDEWLISKLPIVNRQDPMIRLQLGQIEEGRQIVRQMAETPLEYADNARGVATERGGSVETRMKMWHSPLYQAVREIDTNFARYFHSTPEPSAWQRRLSPALSEWDRRRGGQKLTFKQFKEEVGRAAYMGGQHAIPEVRAAAKVYRDLDDRLKVAAIEAGILDEGVTVAGDISHRFRMYNKEKIIAERGRFTDTLYDYFRTAQDAAAFRAEEIRIGNQIVEVDKLRDAFERVDDRVAGIESRLEERAFRRERRQGALEGLREDRQLILSQRAPKPLVDMLRNADETKVMVDAVKEARKAARAAGKKQRSADTHPVLFRLRNEWGGVRIGSKLDYELRAMGVTPMTHVGLFRKNKGRVDLDNLVKEEYEEFVDLPDDGNGYVDPRALYDAIREELGGNPLRSAEERAADEYLDSIDRVASEWLEAVGLPDGSTVKEVRDFLARVLRAERNTEGLDTRISRFEQELEKFDQQTDRLLDERTISAKEAETAREAMDAIEAELAKVADLANTSPRVAIVVDYANAKRAIFQAKIKERPLAKRVEVLRRLEAEGEANTPMLRELSAKEITLGRLRDDIEALKVKADRLEKLAPKFNEADKADEFARLMPDEVRSLVDETIDTILGNADGRIPYDIVAGPRGALKERVLKIETAKIHEFVENDIEQVMRAQIRTMSADIELAKKFGSVDLKEQIRKINDEANAKIAAATTPDERRKLDKARKDTVRDVEGIRDRLRGTYRLPADTSSLVLRAGRIARNINYLRLMGGMTISAVPDMAKVVFTHGLISTFRDGFMPMMRSLMAKDGLFAMAREEVKFSGTGLDMVLDSRTMAMGDIVDEFGHHSRFERGLSALSTKFGVVSLMAPWNATLKQFSGLVTMTNALRAVERVATGKGTTDDIRKLAASGIDEDMAQRIAKEFSAHGQKTKGIYLAKAADWEDPLARDAFRAAIVRDVDRIIVTPGQDKPLWMSTELGKTVGQFKSFAVSTMQRTMLAGLQQRDAATLNGLMLMMGLGALTYAMKETVAGRETSDSPAVWAAEAFDWSGISGWLMEVNNISEKATRGRIGVSALTGKQITRYGSRNVTGAFLGPSADAVADIFQVTGSIFAGDTTMSDLRKARQLLPMQNLFYVRALLNKVEAATGSTLGLPDTRQ